MGSKLQIVGMSTHIGRTKWYIPSGKHIINITKDGDKLIAISNEWVAHISYDDLFNFFTILELKYV